MADIEDLTLEELELADNLEGKSAEEIAAAETAEAEAAAAKEAEAKAAEIKAEELKAAEGAEAAEAARKAGETKGLEWRDTIVDDKHKEIAKRFNSVGEIIQSNIDLRTQNSNSFKAIDENSSEEDIAKFRTQMKIPETPEGYEIKPPEGIEISEADQGIIDIMTPVAHEKGVSQDAYNGFVVALIQKSNEMKAGVQKQVDDYGEEQEANLKKEWGKEYEPNLEMVKRTSANLGGEDFVKFLDETKIEGGGVLGDFPQMVKFLASLGRMTNSDGFLIGGATPEEKMTIQEQIDAMMAEHPVGTSGYRDRAFQTQLTGLYEKLHGDEPIVGSAGRAA